MNRLIICIVLAVASVALYAQDIPPGFDAGQKNTSPFITSMLLEIGDLAKRSPEAALKMAEEKGMPVRGSEVYVEFVMGAESDTDLKFDNRILENIPGVKTTTTFVNRTSAWVEIDQLLAASESLPANHRMNQVILDPGDNQGPGLVNSDSYSTPGGTGMRIAVFDSGWDDLTQTRNAGTVPTLANTTLYNFTGTSFEAGTSDHGTACLENVFDHAPNATYDLYKIFSLSDLGSAVTQAIANNTDVISHSISQYNTGWADNSGAACTAAANASNNGILFFTSAGNRNGTHWQGTFSDNDNDNWHAWNGASDEANNFSINNNGVVRARLQWNSGSTVDHYDFYLYQSGGGVLMSSTNSNSFEEIIYQNTTGGTQNVYLAVQAQSANPPEFEIFNHDSSCTDFQFSSTQGSTTSPSNSTAGNVISVGAVDIGAYTNDAGTTGIIQGYSSRGPTNSGNQAPDVCGPTNTTTVSSGGSFGGTSCATPNAAGAAAAFWSGHPDLSATGVRRILFAKADLYKDWGANGADNLYGRGGVFLHDYHSLNRYVLKSAGNFASSATLPYYSMDDIDDDAPVSSGLHIYYLDGSDNAPGSGDVVNKAMLYRSVGGTVID